MALVVTQPFDFNGKRIPRGAVLFDSDEATIRVHPHLLKCCAAVHDHRFDHLRSLAPPKPSATRPKSKARGS